MLPADPAARAGSTPEASGDSSSGTFSKYMKNPLLFLKCIGIALAAVVVCSTAFCLGAQWAVLQCTNAQLMIDLQIARLLHDGDTTAALREAENACGAYASTLRDYNSFHGFFDVATGLPRIVFKRESLLPDYRVGLADYMRHYPQAYVPSEVASYLQGKYPATVSE